jgi:hypothetical protein
MPQGCPTDWARNRPATSARLGVYLNFEPDCLFYLQSPRDGLIPASCVSSGLPYITLLLRDNPPTRASWGPFAADMHQFGSQSFIQTYESPKCPLQLTRIQGAVGKILTTKLYIVIPSKPLDYSVAVGRRVVAEARTHHSNRNPAAFSPNAQRARFYKS